MMNVYILKKAAQISVAAFLVLSPNSAWAEPSITTSIKYYVIAGSSGKELKRQMKALGPNEYWAYTKWKVRWNRNCEVSVSIKYTFPLLNSRNLLSPIQLEQWEDMRAALIRHEQGHGQHGINAAREILAADCQGGKEITKKWSAQGAIYDAETRHGRTQGISLPD